MAKQDLSGNWLPDDDDAMPRPQTAPGGTVSPPEPVFDPTRPAYIVNLEYPPYVPGRTNGSAPAGSPGGPSSNQPSVPLTPGFDLQENNSGSGFPVPLEVAGLRWNWGAFFLPPLWCASNGFAALGYIYDLLLVLFVLSPFLYGPPVNGVMFWTTFFALFGIGVYLGAKGHEIAWRNRQFDGLSDFMAIQRNWTVAGLAIALPLDVLVTGGLGFLMKVGMDRQRLEAAQSAARSAQSPTAFQPAPTPLPQSPPQQTIIIERNDNAGGLRPGGYSPFMGSRRPWQPGVPGMPVAPTVDTSPAPPPSAEGNPNPGPSNAVQPGQPQPVDDNGQAPATQPQESGDNGGTQAAEDRGSAPANTASDAAPPSDNGQPTAAAPQGTDSNPQGNAPQAPPQSTDSNPGQ